MNKKELIVELCEYVFLNYSRQKVGKFEDGTPMTTNILDGKPRVFALYENIEEIVNTYTKKENKWIKKTSLYLLQ